MYIPLAGFFAAVTFLPWFFMGLIVFEEEIQRIKENR